MRPWAIDAHWYVRFRSLLRTKRKGIVTQSAIFVAHLVHLFSGQHRLFIIRHLRADFYVDENFCPVSKSASSRECTEMTKPIAFPSQASLASDAERGPSRRLLRHRG